ncbi:exocyst complex component exo70a1 [Phtheirospermum japonicum]|uniref:Exocyst subunit Exo70 family protein n=1 Tax=Phtheirospermum japonicum TaxID=374723 RepID=A0A830BAX4_9LAMI|nr:exocyst complex component exo70a1 [Phtheirospermum japonicum]
MKSSLFTSSRPSTPSHSSHHHSNYITPPLTPPPSHKKSSEAAIQENIDYAESIIRKWEFDSHDQFTPLFADDRKEANNFLDAVTGLQRAMHYHAKLNSNSDKLIRAQKLMPIAIKRLEKEFYVILSSNRKNLDSESVSSRSSRASPRSSVSDSYEDEITEEEEYQYNTTPSRTPTRDRDPMSDSVDMAMVDLKSIADCMIASGYGKECINIYRLIRKSIVDETLYYLGFEKLSHSKMQKMEWNVLEAKIKKWLHAVRIAIKTLFQGERILCDVVFSSSEKTAESCFAEISRDAAVNLFVFALNFGNSKKILSPDKIFRALDMYEAISDLWPEVESVFSHESLSAVRSEAVAALVKLGEAVRLMLTQFEAAIKKDTSKSTAGGGVHPLTRYVMNFLVFLADYSGAVSDIVTDWPLNARTPLPESYFSSPTSGSGGGESSITARLVWLVLVLLCKLDAKAVTYNDVALSYLFLANNLNYVVSKVRNSNLGLLIGLEWIWKHRSKVNQYLANYERMGWSSVISSLPEDPTAEISPNEAKECFRRFNLGFEETYKKQTSWVIPDPKLRDQVKMSLAQKLVPGYQAFYEKHRGKYIRDVGVDAVVRYAPEDLNNYLSDLFFAAVGPGGSTTTSHGTYTLSSHGR